MRHELAARTRARRMWLAAFARERSRPSARELVAGTALMLAVSLAAFGSHVADGSFYSDDWQNAAANGFEAEPGLDGAIEHALGRRFFDYRPLAAVAIAVQHEALPVDPAAHLVTSLVLGALASAAVFALMRSLEMERMHALAMAVLVLVFPWSDATLLWPTAALNNLSIVLWAVGAQVALRGMQAVGWRAALAHAGAVVLYLEAILIYEVAAGFVIASALLYPVRGPRRAALQRFYVDAATAGGALVLMGFNTTRSPESLGAQVEHTGRIVQETVSLVGRSIVPALQPRGIAALAAAVLLAVVLAGALLARARPYARSEDRSGLERWLATAGLGVVAIAAGYLLIVPANLAFSPLAPGILNRINLFSAIGYVTLAYSGIVLLRKLCAGGRRPLRIAGFAAAAALGAALVGGYLVQLDADKARWARSAELQERVLSTFEALRPIASGSVVYAFGTPIDAAPGIPVFRHRDLRGAVQLKHGDASIGAYAMYPGTELVCGRQAMYPEGSGYGVRGKTEPDELVVEAVVGYGKAYVVDVRLGRFAVIDDRRECVRERRRLEPGPLVASTDR